MSRFKQTPLPNPPYRKWLFSTSQRKTIDWNICLVQNYTFRNNKMIKKKTHYDHDAKHCLIWTYFLKFRRVNYLMPQKLIKVDKIVAHDNCIKYYLHTEILYYCNSRFILLIIFKEAWSELFFFSKRNLDFLAFCKLNRKDHH